MGHLLLPGQDKMFSGKGINPWHFAETGKDGRTIVIPTNATLEQALEITGLADEEVRSERVENITLASGLVLPAPALWDSESENESRTYAIIRNGKAIAFATERYRPLTTATLLEPVTGLIGKANAVFTTMGTIRGGRQVFAVMELPDKEVVLGGDNYKRYLVFFTSHDGSMRAQYLWSSVRVVCANTVRMALDRDGASAYYIKHTTNAEEQVRDAMRALEVGERFDASFKKQTEHLLATAFPRTEWNKLVETLIPVKTPETGEPTKAAVTSANNRREKLEACYMAEDLNNIRGTANGALQAVIDFDQHVRGVRQTPTTTKDEARLLRSLSDSSLTRIARDFVQDYAGVA